MRHAGAREHLPVVGGDGALVADGQRNQHAAIALIGQRPPETLSNRLAQGLDDIGRSRHERIQPLGPRNGAACRPDIAGGAYAALQ